MRAGVGLLSMLLIVGTSSSAAAQTTGTIAGTVTASADGTAVTAATVFVFDSGRKFVESAPTDASGNYSAQGLAAGTYYELVSSTGFVQQLYAAIPCVAADCDADPYLGMTGTAVTVTAGTTTTVNIALDRGGTIGGTVTRASDGAAATGSTIVIYNTATSRVQTIVANPDGTYTASALPAGTYFARVQAPAGLIDQLFSGTSCPAPCRIDLGTPISVTANATTTGINFNLASAPASGQIAGHAVLASSGQAAVSLGSLIQVYSGSVNVASGAVRTDGSYTVSGLAPGTYYVRTSAPAGATWVDQWYGGACVGCPSAERGRPVVVASGATTGGVDFTIDDAGGAISGALTLPGLSTNVMSPSVQIYSADGTLVKTWSAEAISTVPADQTVSWSVAGLPSGTYYVRTFGPTAGASTPIHGFVPASGGYWIDELFDNIVCVAADCLPTRGTPVVVTAHTNTPNVNFTLDYGAQISGKAPNWFFGQTRMDVFDARGVPLPNRADHDQNLGYVARGLPAGTYYLRYHNPAVGVRDVLYKDIPCDGCAVTTGTPVPVVLGDNKTGIDFSQITGQAITGTVRTSGGQPLSTITIEAYAANGDFVTSTLSMADGSYHLDGGGSQTSLAPGTYYLRTSNQRGYVDQLYNGITCEACDPLRGTPVTVTTGADTTGVDFTLSAGSQFVSGMVADGNGVPLSGVDVLFSTASPASTSARATSDAAGHYIVSLPAASYFAQTAPAAGYVQQIYNGVVCPQGNCPASSATAVVVSSSSVSGIDFALAACTPATIAPLRLAQAAVGIAYRQTLVATGGTGTKRFVVASGDLPPGLSLDPATGVVSGTPTAAGAYTFTIGVSDDTGCVGTRTYTLDVPSCVFTFPYGSSAGLWWRGAPWLVVVTTACGSYNATPDVSWLTAQIVSQGVIVVAAENTGPPREGHVVIGPRVFTVYQGSTASGVPFGAMDTPSNGAVVSGSIAVSGWSLDDLGAPAVDVYRDPVGSEIPGQLVFLGRATHVTGARPDVEALYPTFRGSTFAGWGYLLLTNMLPNGGNGVFNLYAYAVDSDGITIFRTLLGARTITALNATAIAPFGAIDTPDQGAIASGSTYVNFGWALTPQPKMIPFDGSTIHVLIDGVSVGTLTAYNLFRQDVSGLFPGLKNSGGPVGYRVIDTTALSEGVHTIAWTVTDDAGATQGIGSRYFTVQNSAWTPALMASSLIAPPAFTVSEIAAADSTTVVPPRVDGIDIGRKAASLATLPVGPDGTRTIALGQLQRLKIDLGTSEDAPYSCGGTYDGYLVANGELRALPTGSSLDRRGMFYWQPGPGFFGTYRFLFVRTACDGTRERIPVAVTIH